VAHAAHDNDGDSDGEEVNRMTLFELSTALIQRNAFLASPVRANGTWRVFIGHRALNEVRGFGVSGDLESAVRQALDEFDRLFQRVSAARSSS
jgi:hypothetical protein